MLTSKEKDGIKDLIEKLKEEDLFSLTFTVTKGFIKPENKHEAVEAILLYCENASLLLRRKKVKKDLIFNYLREKGVIVSVHADKIDYVKSCLHYWESDSDCVQNEDLMDDFAEDSVNCIAYNEDSSLDNTGPELPAINPYATYCSLNPSDVVSFGQSFVLWFFQLLNQNNSGSRSCLFIKEAFVPDCTFSWLAYDTERVFSGTVQDPFQVMQVINEMIFTNRLIFNPGTEGVLSRYDPHGIMQIHVQGVVNQLDNSVGLYEQTFGLFRDVSEANCWKIKKSELKLTVAISLTKVVLIEYKPS